MANSKSSKKVVNSTATVVTSAVEETQNMPQPQPTVAHNQNPLIANQLTAYKQASTNRTERATQRRQPLPEIQTVEWCGINFRAFGNPEILKMSTVTFSGSRTNNGVGYRFAELAGLYLSLKGYALLMDSTAGVNGNAITKVVNAGGYVIIIAGQGINTVKGHQDFKAFLSHVATGHLIVLSRQKDDQPYKPENANKRNALLAHVSDFLFVPFMWNTIDDATGNRRGGTWNLVQHFAHNGKMIFLAPKSKDTTDAEKALFFDVYEMHGEHWNEYLEFLPIHLNSENLPDPDLMFASILEMLPKPVVIEQIKVEPADEEPEMTDDEYFDDLAAQDARESQPW